MLFRQGARSHSQKGTQKESQNDGLWKEKYTTFSKFQLSIWLFQTSYWSFLSRCAVAVCLTLDFPVLPSLPYLKCFSFPKNFSKTVGFWCRPGQVLLKSTTIWSLADNIFVIAFSLPLPPLFQITQNPSHSSKITAKLLVKWYCGLGKKSGTFGQRKNKGFQSSIKHLN